jgi:TolB protein
MPTLYKMNIVTGSLDRILQTEGMLACSDVSQDGKKILLTMAPYGQPDIYLYNTETKTKKALTKYSGIDVSAHFIENDKRFTFVSNRLGFPTIFAKEIEGKKRAIEQLVYYGKNNNSCTSHNNYIIYSSRETDNSFSQNTFNLHLISTDTNYVRRLTATGINQFPQFSSDGESVLFIKHFKKQSSLGIIRLNYNKNFLFPLNVGKIQSIDW